MSIFVGHHFWGRFGFDSGCDNWV